jgi:RNA polymerase sigma-70 factor (ECF subfamily)
VPNPGSMPATEWLARAGAGDEGARRHLLDLLYGELRQLAERAMRNERAGHTLQPTALVHEAWLRLIGDAGTDWDSRSRFLGLAATAMRNVLIDHARRRQTTKRGDDPLRVELDEVLAAYQERATDVLRLDEALERLAQRDPELARIVELRFFGGLTVEETARVLGRTLRQVERAWVIARGWLHRELSRADGARADGSRGGEA